MRPPDVPRSPKSPLTDDKQIASGVYPLFRQEPWKIGLRLADVTHLENDMDIGPGDFVECVDASPGKLPHRLVAGAIYLVTGHPHAWGITLKEEPSKNPSGFSVYRFRPIYRPKPSAFTDLLKVPDKTKILA